MLNSIIRVHPSALFFRRIAWSAAAIDRAMVVKSHTLIVGARPSFRTSDGNESAICPTSVRSGGMDEYKEKYITSESITAGTSEAGQQITLFIRTPHRLEKYSLQQLPGLLATTHRQHLVSAAEVLLSVH